MKTANSTKAKTLGYESNCEVWAEKIQKTKPARTQGMAVPEDLRKKSRRGGEKNLEIR